MVKPAIKACDLFGPQTWHVRWVGVNDDREFTSITAFDGYVGEARRLGCTVTFAGPYACTLQVPK